MATLRRFEELECWQEARRFVKLVYETARNDRFKKDFELASQIRRSAISAMANIAEGFHRSSSKEFMKFLDYSRSSIAETLSHSYIAADQGYITEHELATIRAQADMIWKKANSLISYLRRSNKGPSVDEPKA